jgi:hypothetical protein
LNEQLKPALAVEFPGGDHFTGAIEMIAEQPKPEQQDTSVQVSKTQFEFAVFQIQNLQELMQRADSKAQFVLGANTVLISVIVILFPDIRSIFLKGGGGVMLIYGGLLVVLAATTLVSMLLAFLVVYPIYSPLSRGVTPSLIYFREIARLHDAEKYKEALLNSSLQDIVTNAASEIYGMSLGAGRKYRFLQSSTICLIANVILWTLILAVILFFPF